MTPYPMRPLTKRQREVFDFVRDSILANGYAPSLEEVGTRFGLRSLATVHKHMENLKLKGYFARVPNRSRATVLLTREGTCSHCGQVMP